MVDSKQTVFRNDAVAKVTGRAKYADDYTFHGMIHAVPVYTDSVHAEIIKIDTAEAEALEGVRKVLTWRDVPGKAAFGQIEKDLYIFAKDKIRYHGDVAALVVADTRDIAVEASKLVHVELKELPPVLDQEKALLEGAPRIHEQFIGNKIAHHHVRRGDAEKAFPHCDLIVEREFRTSFVEHAYIEPECAFANPRTDGVIELYGTFQHPFSTRRFVSAYLGKQFADFDVYSHPVGGSFGGKDDTISVIAARAALAASILKVPVKFFMIGNGPSGKAINAIPTSCATNTACQRRGRLWPSTATCSPSRVRPRPRRPGPHGAPRLSAQGLTRWRMSTPMSSAS